MFGHKASHIPQLHEIWLEKRELNLKRSNLTFHHRHVGMAKSTRFPAPTLRRHLSERPMPDAVELSSVSAPDEAVRDDSTPEKYGVC
jgi:hypothetical protein